MYEVGAYVVKAGSGLCQVEGIVHPDFEMADSEKLYYLLVPVSNKAARLYMPTDRGDESLRTCMTKKEAIAVLKAVPDIEAVWVANEKLREQAYKEAMRSTRPEAMVSLIKNIYIRRVRRNAQGKKNTAIDDRFFKMAEEILYSELAFALGKDKSEVGKAIIKSIHENDCKEI